MIFKIRALKVFQKTQFEDDLMGKVEKYWYVKTATQPFGKSIKFSNRKKIDYRLENMKITRTREMTTKVVKQPSIKSNERLFFLEICSF